jgi:hypothetical protein
MKCRRWVLQDLDGLGPQHRVGERFGHGHDRLVDGHDARGALRERRGLFVASGQIGQRQGC